MPTVPKRADDQTAQSVLTVPCAFRHGSHTGARRPTDDPTVSEPKTGTVTPWLQQKIATSRRHARPDTCPRCNTPNLVGPDHDTCARVVRVDTTPVDRIHEIAALLTGRYSYNLVRNELHYREPHHIHSTNQTEPIHLNHQCDTNGATLW